MIVSYSRETGYCAKNATQRHSFRHKEDVRLLSSSLGATLLSQCKETWAASSVLLLGVPHLEEELEGGITISPEA